jgi:hypothetical protein
VVTDPRGVDQRCRCASLPGDQRACSNTRVPKRSEHDIANPSLAVPDRDLAARLPQIELADLTRPIHPALKRARRQDNGLTLRK